MGTAKTLFSVFLLCGALSAVLWKIGHRVLPSPTLPSMSDGWWAKENKANFKEDASIRPFKISVPNEILDDLKVRLQNARIQKPLNDVEFQYGFNTNYLKEVKDYWLNKYDWRKEETRLNQLTSFKTQLEGIDMHFIHSKPANVPSDVQVVPLLMVHGWPGSLVELYKIIPLLNKVDKEKKFVFEVVAPHIPGYGFSEAPHRAGFGPLDAAKIFHKLMQRLGHKKYFVHGGDWGSLITSYMAMIYPESVSGLHVTMLTPTTTGQWLKMTIGNYLPFLVIDDKDQSRLYPMGEKMLFWLQETGYMHIQATKPDTVGVGLGDSPIGLAAYILEKFSTWTNRKNVELYDGGLTKKFTLDELLTNVMVYWVTNSISSSMRFYKECFIDRPFDIDSIPIRVPTAIADFPQELGHVPQALAEHRFHNIVQFTRMPAGGHFSSMEEPELVANDLNSFIKLVLRL